MQQISIIVPVYNAECYIKKCISSILNQTFSDFELILVDDGSTDSSATICDESAQSDSRIKVFHQANSGVSAARNAGVEKSSGKYITFVDSDDEIDKNYLHILYNNLIDGNADFSMCQIIDVRNGEFKQPKFSNNLCTYSNRQAVEHFGMINGKNFFNIFAKLIERSIIENNKFPVGRAYSEDRAVLYKWYFAAKKIVESDASLYLYNVIESSVSHRPYDYYMLAELDTEKEMLDFFKDNNFPELYDKYLHLYLYEISRQHDELLNKFSDKSKAQELKRLLRSVVKRNKKYDISIHNDPACYNVLHPFLMNIYWLILHICKKIQKQG